MTVVYLLLTAGCAMMAAGISDLYLPTQLALVIAGAVIAGAAMIIDWER